MCGQWCFQFAHFWYAVVDVCGVRCWVENVLSVTFLRDLWVIAQTFCNCVDDGVFEFVVIRDFWAGFRVVCLGGSLCVPSIEGQAL